MKTKENVIYMHPGGNLWETDFKHGDITNCFNINDYISSNILQIRKVLKKAGIQEDALRKHKKSADDISTPNGVTLLTLARFSL